jgi:hypothetical protein
MLSTHTATVSIGKLPGLIPFHHTFVPQAKAIHVAAILDTILAIWRDLSDMLEGGMVIASNVSLPNHCGMIEDNGFLSRKKAFSEQVRGSNVAQGTMLLINGRMFNV